MPPRPSRTIGLLLENTTSILGQAGRINSATSHGFYFHCVGGPDYQHLSLSLYSIPVASADQTINLPAGVTMQIELLASFHKASPLPPPSSNFLVEPSWSAKKCFQHVYRGISFDIPLEVRLAPSIW